jgi:rubrerythrin
MPLFDKLESDTLLAWVERQARKPVSRSTPRSTLPRLELECMRCGYGIVSAAPPRECPMCHTVAAWTAPARTRHASHYDHAVRF